MSEDKQKSVSFPELETKEVGAFGNPTLHIAYYQRGYRWKPAQVRQLLEDIDSFQPTHKAQSYFLQALVLAEKDEGIYVVDGQQRLTTIALIQKCLGVPESFSLVYQRNPDKGSTGSIDKFYQDEATKTIADWFNSRSDTDKHVFSEKLNHACFLIYRIHRKDELAVFGRLNSGKITAKDSELVKYIMLTPQQDEPWAVTQSRAREWDEIERGVSDEPFFSYFVQRGTWGEEDRMAMLFCFAGLCQDLEQAKSQNEVFPFFKCIQDQLKEKSRQEMWKHIYGSYYTLTAWYNDPAMYHAVGWYLHRNNAPAIWKIHPTEFHSALVKVLESMNAFMSSATLEDETKHLKDVYTDDPKKTSNFLLLFNVAFCWRRWPQKYDFEKHREVDGWSLEHIVAQNETALSKEEFLNFAPGILKEEHWPGYKTACDERRENVYLSENLPDSYPSEDDHSIQNLALLSTRANSSLNNALFERKRTQIRDWSENQNAFWIPPATQAAFFKTIPGTDMAVHFWSNNDRQQYVKAMKETTTAFVEAVKKVITHE